MALNWMNRQPKNPMDRRLKVAEVRDVLLRHFPACRVTNSEAVKSDGKITWTVVRQYGEDAVASGVMMEGRPMLGDVIAAVRVIERQFHEHACGPASALE